MRTFLLPLLFFLTASTGRSQLLVRFPPGPRPPMLDFAVWEVLRAAGKTPPSLAIDVEDKEGPAESFRIDVRKGFVTVSAPDDRGKMYGLLDAAEQLRIHGTIHAKAEAPFLKYRILKFNPPLKGNVYLAKEEAQKSSWFFDLDYWKAFFTMMARARYNVVSFWHSHPFGNMVRLKKYPEAAVLKGKEMDRAIRFWHALFRLAHDHGIQVFWVTWNIHWTPGFAKAHGLARRGVDSPLVRDYMKECIRETLREYPEIDGFGTCAGEAMHSLPQARREDFIRECYLGPMLETGRRMTFLHRYWNASPDSVTALLKKVKWPGDVLLSLKFNGEHVYSSPRPHVLDKRWMETKDRPYKLLWHLRNDCIYQLDWGDPDFASAVIRNCAGSGGFLMGSEVEIPGEDRFHTPRTAWHRKWKYTFQKHWFRWMVWGRAGYDPNVGDEPFLGEYTARYGKEMGALVYRAVKEGSRIIPLVTSFHWNYMNGDWYPEGNIGGWNTSYEVPRRNYRSKGKWHSLEDYVYNNTIDDTFVGIPEAVARQAAGLPVPSGRRTPEMVADSLDRISKKTARLADRIEGILLAKAGETGKDLSPRAREEARRKALESSGMEGLDCALRDIRCVSLLGAFYSAQIRAARVMAARIFGAAPVSREECAARAEKAARIWAELSRRADGHYLPHEIYIMGRFSWGMYLPEARKEPKIAASLPPIPREERTWLVEGRKVRTLRWLHTGNRDKDGWIDFMNRITARVRPGKSGVVRTRVEVPSERKVRLVFRGAGLDPSSPPGWKQTGKDTFTAVLEKTALLSLRVNPQKGKEGFLFETRLLGDPGDALVFPAFRGKALPPFKLLPDKGSLHGKCLVLPKGVGHGKKGYAGPIIDNGWVDFAFTARTPGDYRLWARVVFRDPDSNSFFVVLDGKLRGMLADDKWNRWHWTALPGSIRLKAGKHLLRIRNREDGVKLDEVRLLPADLDARDLLPLSPAEKTRVFEPGEGKKNLEAYFKAMTPIHPPSHTENLKSWKRHRLWVRKRVLHDIGLEPMPPRLPLDARIVSTLRREGYTVNRLYFRILPRCYGSGWLYLPGKIHGKAPAVLNPHGHWAGGATHPVCQSRMIALAKKGYIALMTDSIHAADFETGMVPIGLMTLQNIRALDYLCSRPDVDTSRLAVTGASGGGQQTMYMMCVEDRLRAAAPVVMACYFARILTPWGAHCWCNHAPGIATDTDMTELLSVFAPKPALFLSSSKDWTSRFPYEEFKEVRKVWALYGAASAVSCTISDAPHGYGKPRREAVYRFLNGRLAVDDPDEGREPPVAPEKPAALRAMEKPVPGLRDWAAAAAWYRSVHKPSLTPARIPAALASLLRAVPPPEAAPEALSRGSFSFPGGKAKRLLLAGEKGFRIPALLLAPSRTARPAPAVILLSPGGKADAFDSRGRPIPLVRALLERGARVLALDARFTGETAADWERNCLAWGRPAAGMAADDARWAAAWLARRRETAPRRISVAGLGKMGPAALFAAALEAGKPGGGLFSALLFDARGGMTYGNHPLHDMPGYYGGRKRLKDLDLPVVPQVLDAADLPGITGAVTIPRLVLRPGRTGWPGAAVLPPELDQAAATARFLTEPR